MKIILLIGRIGCGKSTYARSLADTLLLSCDQLMQTMFPGGCGEMHDTYAARCKEYLYPLARRCADAGVTPVLDWGFWTKEMRQSAVDALAGYELDWRYLDPDRDIWLRRIEGRNTAILEGRADPADYFVDEGLMNKLQGLFDPPTEHELPGLTIIRD